MTKTMTATAFKATALAVLDSVACGEDVEVTKHGRPIARIVPIHNPTSLCGRYAGIVGTNASDEELFSTGETWEAS